MSVHSTTVDGITMRWEEEGVAGADGQVPVVFVHGIPTSPRLWRHVLPLVRGRRLAWEMVGYGESIPEGAARDLSLARQADYLMAWLRAVGAWPAVLVGHDLGGGVAQIVAVREFTACAGLVLVDSVSYDSWPILPVKALRAAGALTRRLPGSMFRRAVLGPLMALGHDDRERARESLGAHWQPYRHHGGAAAFLRQARALHATDTLAVAPYLGQVNVPARVLWGSADPFQRLRYGQRLARDLDAPLVTLEGARHFVPEDRPEAVAAAVEEVAAEAGPAR
ncbi:MAG: alpha/beta fold hydrolase [Actinobacteria bacterium]|nr:alpha/beta fold hydrolase [Actinomycetota bacterium]